jgi:NitT/TauT family transport system substrate-binding protein
VIDSRGYALHVCLLLILLLAACAPAEVAEPQLEPVTLRAVSLPYLTFSPLFIAQEEGYFAEQGLSVEFVKLSGSEEAIPALAQGQLDVGGGTVSTALLNAIAQGTNIKVVADQGYLATDGCTFSGYLARQDLVEEGQLERPSQLRDRPIVVQQMASMDGYRMEKLLEKGDLTLSDIEPVRMASSAQLEAFEKGTIDLAGTAEPWVTRLVSTGHAALWIPAQQVIPDFQIAFIVFGPSILEENPDAGRRFMVAYLKAIQQYNEGKTERNLELLTRHTGLDREFLMHACWPPYHEDGQINVQSVLDFQTWAVEKEYLDSPVTEKQFWDSSFVEYANEELGAPSD